MPSYKIVKGKVKDGKQKYKIIENPIKKPFKNRKNLV